MFNDVIVWLVAAFLFLLIEIGHPGLFFFLSFSIAAAFTTLYSIYIADCGSQLIFFALSSFVTLFILKRFVSTTQKTTLTNSDALKGRQVFVETIITPVKPGTVKIDGVTWTALSNDGRVYHPSTLVTIVVVRGAHCVVKSAHTPTIS